MAGRGSLSTVPGDSSFYVSQSLNLKEEVKAVASGHCLALVGI